LQAAARVARTLDQLARLVVVVQEVTEQMRHLLCRHLLQSQLALVEQLVHPAQMEVHQFAQLFHLAVVGMGHQIFQQAAKTLEITAVLVEVQI
jgi:hypothetical protein